MIYNNIDFFNTAELADSHDGTKGLLRFPKNTISEMFSEYSASCAKGCELRFVTDAENISLTLRADDDAPAKAIVWRGDYYIEAFPLKAKENTVINLTTPERFSWVEREALVKRCYSPDVWRVLIDTGLASFVSLDTHCAAVRPPMPNELPEKKWLAYGSSITYGEKAVYNSNCYARQAAFMLGIDVLNKGCSGACAIENATADYFGAEDWDIISLEIGVNMRNVIAPEEFRHKTCYMIDKLLQTHRGKKIFVITMLPNHSIRTVVGSEFKSDHIAFNKILNELCECEYKNTDVFLIQGEELLPDFGGLSSDLIHPSDYGHTMIAQRLAKIIKNSGSL